MKKQEMRTLILEMLSGLIPATDFRLKRSENAFIRRIMGGRQSIVVPLIDYNPEFRFSLVMCVRIDAAEEILNAVMTTPPENRSMSETIITQLRYFTGDPLNHSYSVSTAEDVVAVGRVLRGIIVDKVLPFLDDNRDVHTLNRSVNGQMPSVDSTNQPYGAMHAVILAHLAKNPDYDRIVAKYRTEWQLAPEADHPFNRLVEYLKTH